MNTLISQQWKNRRTDGHTRPSKLYALIALLPESLKTVIVLAGLLTCSISESLPIPVQEGQWQLEKSVSETF